jgi:hypothetical protein
LVLSAKWPETIKLHGKNADGSGGHCEEASGNRAFVPVVGSPVVEFSIDTTGGPRVAPGAGLRRSDRYKRFSRRDPFRRGRLSLTYAAYRSAIPDWHPLNHAKVVLRRTPPGVAMYFGLYLYKNGMISAEQLVAAADIQLSTLTRIGQLALEEGIMSARDVFDVLHVQRETPNQRFGELAVEMGLMTRDDLGRLLMIQSDRKRPIEEILIAQGVLEEQQAARAKNDFRQTLGKPRAGCTVPSKIAPRRWRRRARTMEFSAAV